MAYIVKLEDPEVLDTETFQLLFTDAFPPGNFWYEQGYAATPDRFKELIGNPQFGVFVAAEGGELVGLAVILLPADEFDGVPQFAMFYNAGSAAARGQLLDAAVDFIRGHGHMKFRAINGTQKPDSIWSRLFARAGKSHRVASIMEFDLDT